MSRAVKLKIELVGDMSTKRDEIGNKRVRWCMFSM